VVALTGITSTIEPSLGDKLLYVPIVAIGTPRAMVNFKLRLTYEPAPGGPAIVEATRLSVSFPGSSVATQTYTVSGTLRDDNTLGFFLDDWRPDGAPDDTRGSIAVPSPIPATVRIEVTFAGYDPVAFDRPLQAHANPTPDGSYLFPFKAADLGSEEYIYFSGTHFPSESQHWGYDFVGVTWDGNDWVRSTGGENTDSVIYGKNLYASTDGIVLRAVDEWVDNPRAPLRTVVREGAMERGPAGVVSIAAADPDRIFSVVTDQEKQLLVLVFAPAEDSRSLELLGKSAPGLTFAGTALSTTALSTTRVVTAGAAGGKAIVALYEASPDGTTVTSHSAIVLADTAAIRVVRRSSTQLLMARQPIAGDLEVSLWDVGPGLPAKATFVAKAVGTTTCFDLAYMDANSFVTAVKTGSGKLKVIVWNTALDDDKLVTGIARGKDCDVDATVDQLAVARTDLTQQFMVASRNGDGDLAVHFFQVDPNTAEVEFQTSEVTGAVGSVAAVLFKRGQMATAVIAAGGEAKLIGYEARVDAETDVWSITRTADFTDPGGVVTAIDVDRIKTSADIETCAVAVRTSSGKLKVILWRLTQANSVQILYGDECVTYTHLKFGSVSKKLTLGAAVTRGQYLAQAGFSGTASGPHLHIDCVKTDIDSRNLTRAQRLLIESGGYKIKGTPRPMLFNGVSAITLGNLKTGGVAVNAFVVVNDAGFYFNKTALYPSG
jgi:hypothetical protein